MTPFLDETAREYIICTTSLTDGAMLDNETIYYLQAKGIDISIAEDNCLDHD